MAKPNPPRRERRRRERRVFPHYMQFRNDETGELVGSLADISLIGFRLEGTTAVKPHSDVQFRVDLPPEVPGKASIVLTAQSRWVESHPVDPRLYIMGYEIRHIDPADSPSFQILFERFGANASAPARGYDYAWQD